MFRPTRLLLIHRRVHVYATIIIYTPFPFPPARRVDVQLYILFFHWIIYIYRSRFFRVEASRLFIEPRAHDCYLSIDDKRNPIREARLTRIEKVGKKDWKINVTLFKKKKSILFSSSVTINPFVDTCNESEESIVPEIFSVSRSVRSFEYMYTCRVIRDSCVGIRRENV